jgi:hypothetical protein
VGELREGDHSREAELLAVCGESGWEPRLARRSELISDYPDFQHVDPNFEHRGTAHSRQQTCRTSISAIGSENWHCSWRLNKLSHSLYTFITSMGYVQTILACEHDPSSYCCLTCARFARLAAFSSLSGQYEDARTTLK